MNRLSPDPWQITDLMNLCDRPPKIKQNLIVIPSSLLRNIIRMRPPRFLNRIKWRHSDLDKEPREKISSETLLMVSHPLQMEHQLRLQTRARQMTMCGL